MIFIILHFTVTAKLYNIEERSVTLFEVTQQ